VWGKSRTLNVSWFASFRAGVPVAMTEVRFQDLNIATTVSVGSRALPSLTNDIINMALVSPCRSLPKVSATRRPAGAQAMHSAACVR